MAKVDELQLLIEARKAVRSGTGIQVRRAANLSQGELARAVAVHPASLSRWESRLCAAYAGFADSPDMRERSSDFSASNSSSLDGT